MLKSEKKLAELKKILTNGKYNEIHDRISILRVEEPFEGAIRLLAHHYDETNDEGLKLIISAFFNDMKERSGRAEVIELNISSRQPSSKAMLVSSCWQSGLDYSEFAISLAEEFMTGDYLTSLECFTVLENCSGSISANDRTIIILGLEKEMGGFDTARQKLAGELIALLKRDRSGHPNNCCRILRAAVVRMRCVNVHELRRPNTSSKYRSCSAS
ncbi:MAG: hypothetical protein U5L72_08310 [Bacteroidales bacterium]|nr:hypothetical protein [Bacteroidales bacterium]